MQIVKRDGRKVDFEKAKIKNAMLKAFNGANFPVDEKAKSDIDLMANFIEEHCHDGITVEEIQDMVEKRLMISKYKTVAKEYILYRDKRTAVRYQNSPSMRLIKEKVKATNVQYQNGNVDEYSFGGRKGEAGDVVLRDVADEMISEKSRYNHYNNLIYEHDYNSASVGLSNCLSLPIDKIWKNGFTVKQGDVRGVHSIGSALQVLAVAFQVQSLEQFGLPF